MRTKMRTVLYTDAHRMVTEEKKGTETTTTLVASTATTDAATGSPSD